ncbi:type II secretion system protein [Quadrisphaera sp. INWT6]|uniref:type II secretion system protein n=1 Tax=Quadrisphaera sp. INWT6 TaxID=2596917 RepID=UPI001892670D|nr:prepilin-type N-terminal cleavage/methylation domain-containing protein [Quadrisphaera sp. INWT6]MBF5083691.1 prepilin-type N-terminal cleavage/methylation domain-containing protein [Quadrisphaera sp. INWT6]
MMARIRKAMEEKDQGFTLIELLVVMIIIGILAAIAVPVFLNQRQKAVDSSIKSDLRTVAQSAETAMVDAQSYPAAATGTVNSTTGAATITVGTTTTALSNGNLLAYTVSTDGTYYCVAGSNAKATASGASPGNGSYYWYTSKGGGLQGAATSTKPSTCP